MARIRFFLAAWGKVTSDHYVVSVVLGNSLCIALIFCTYYVRISI